MPVPISCRTEPEKNHIASALIFELSEVETRAVRERVVLQLRHVSESLANRVAAGLWLENALKPADTKVPAKTGITPSPALSIIGKAPETVKGCIIGCLITDGVDRGILEELRKSVEKEGARLKIVAPHIGGAETDDRACSRLTCASMAARRFFLTQWR